MLFLHVLIVAVFIFAFVRGYIKGFVVAIGSLVGIILAIYISKWCNPSATLVFEDWFGFPPVVAKPLAYAGVFIALCFIFYLLTKLLDKVVETSLLNGTNKFLGIFFYLLKYALIISLFLNVFEAIDSGNKLIAKSKKESSPVYYPLQKLVPTIIPFIDFSDFVGAKSFSPEKQN